MSEDTYQPSLVEAKRDQFVVISGCSGSGKSSLLSELADRGHRIWIEPGRQIVKEQLSIGGDALPWQNPDKFIELVLSRAMHQMIVAAGVEEISFFDRGIVDAVKHFHQQGIALPPHIAQAAEKYRYNRRVFMSPPWREIYRNDQERRHSFETATVEYDWLLRTYASLGYEIVTIPKLSPPERAEFVLQSLRG